MDWNWISLFVLPAHFLNIPPPYVPCLGMLSRTLSYFILYIANSLTEYICSPLVLYLWEALAAGCLCPFCGPVYGNEDSAAKPPELSRVRNKAMHS
jgi:hypothetical protein